MPEAATVLEAGGLVPPDHPIPADLPVDAVDARGYRHPGVPGRVVVRLVPDAVAAGVDTEMGLLGFALSDHANDIALQRRRTLGFPGHALVIDPEHARYALDVMREFKGHAKRIASKPGHARDGFEAVADRLSRQVPHFLPSYWEEVGRAFASAGNLSYAAQSFDKARAAEQQFGLDVDEERRGEAFLEFALLGGLSVKSLQSYGKELQKSVGPAKAYERMAALAVRRTLGGLPPWASLPKDLRSLAKAARLDANAADEAFLRQVLPASALVRAPASFWAEYRDAVVRLAQADPAVRARLLDLFPTGGKASWAWRSDDDGFRDTWMHLLADSGALAAIHDPSAEGLPQGGRAAWFGRLQDWTGDKDGWALQLLRRSASALKAEGAPLPLRTGDWSKPLDLDLLDLVLELGLPWRPATDPPYYRIDLAKWADRAAVPARLGFAAEDRPRDPVHAASDPAVRDLLGPAIDAVFGNPTFEPVAAGKRGLNDLRRLWLERQIADLDRTGLASTALALGRLEAATRPTTFAEFPEAYAALQRAEVGKALHRTLVTGIFDEFAWPAFDAAMAVLGPAPGVEMHVTRQWPHLLVANGQKLFVLGPKGVELVHDLKLGKSQLPDGTAFVGGQAVVAWSTWQPSYQRKAYWTSDPQDPFDVENTHFPRQSYPVAHPDAIVVAGHRYAVGDRAPVPDGSRQWVDRTGAWAIGQDGTVRVFDRQTGALGGEGAPGFLADVIGRPHVAAYYVVPDEVAATSPLGGVDGHFGAKFVPSEDEGAAPGALDLVTLAGDRVGGPVRFGSRTWFAGCLVRWPGADRPRRVVEEMQWWRNAHDPMIYVADGDEPVISMAQEPTVRLGRAWLPPVQYWHYFVPRDPAGSQALRALTREASDAVLAGGQVPGVTDERLRDGVRHVAEVAAKLKERLDKLVAERAGGSAAAVSRPAADVADNLAAPLFANLKRYWGYVDLSVTAAIRTLGRFLRDGETGEAILFSRLEPHDWIGRIRGIAWAATRPGTTDAERDVLARVLRAWADSGLADDGHVRVGTLRFAVADPAWMPVREVNGRKLPHGGWRHDEKAIRLFAWGVSESDDAGPWTATFVDTSPDGTFEVWPGAEVLSERRVRIAGDRAWLEGLLDRLRTVGPRPASAERAEALADAIGSSVPEAATVLAAFPREWSKEAREAFGLKLALAKSAARQFEGWSLDQKLDLLTAAAPADPAVLWTDAEGPLAAAWVARHGRAVAVPADLLAAADKEVSGGGLALKLVANHAETKALSTDGGFEVDPKGQILASDPHAFTGELAMRVVSVLSWLWGRGPVGDPLRAQIPAVYAKASERARNPALVVPAGHWHMYDPKARKAAEAFFDALGGDLAKPDPDDAHQAQRRVGPLVATKSQWAVQLAVRAAGLDPGARELVRTFAKASGAMLHALHALDLLRSDALRELVARVTDTPLRAGEWEQAPSRSAPEVVAGVRRAHGLGEEAAVLYVQTLALLEPTKRNVLAWNDWSSGTYAAAAAELVGKGLVLEGKRARAGREHFLPGGWLEESALLPYEEWKRPLYGWDAGLGGFQLGAPRLLEPIHVVFARAWERCAKGDVPAFEEVRR